MLTRFTVTGPGDDSGVGMAVGTGVAVGAGVGAGGADGDGDGDDDDERAGDAPAASPPETPGVRAGVLLQGARFAPGKGDGDKP